nr:hypothetical protein [Tanacetum cinerariifolium]
MAVNNARPRAVNTARPNSAVVNAVRVNQVNAVKTSACEHMTTTSNDPLLSGLGDHEDASKQRRMIDELDADEGVALVDETQGRNDQDIFYTSILDDEKVVAKKEVSTADPVPTASEVVTIAGEVVTIAGVETSKPKANGIVMQDPSETPTPTLIDYSQQPSKAKDKGKAKMIKPEKPLKRKDHIMIDEEVARNLEA